MYTKNKNNSTIMLLVVAFAILVSIGLPIVATKIMDGISLSREAASISLYATSDASKKLYFQTQTAAPTRTPAPPRPTSPASSSQASPVPKPIEVYVQKSDGSTDARANDLEELCKDWLYYRKKIMEAESAGKTEKAAKYRESFQQVNAWLDEYNESDITATFERLEAQGYSPP